MTKRQQMQPAVPSDLARCWSIVLLAWAVPGAGHLALGKRARAAVFILIIGVAIVLGCLLHGNLHRLVPNQPLSIVGTLAAMGMGIPYFLLRFGFGYTGDIAELSYEYGTAFLLCAGLMNLLLVLDVWDLCSGRKE